MIADAERELGEGALEGGEGAPRDAAVRRGRSPTTPMSKLNAGAGGTESRTGPRCWRACTRAGPSRRGFKVELARRERRRRGGHQVRDLQRAGRERLRLAEDRVGRASAGAHLALRRQRAPAHVASPASGSIRWSTTTSRSRFSTRTCASTPIAPRAPAASTSTRPTRRCASRTSRPASPLPCQHERSQHQNTRQGHADAEARAWTMVELQKREAERLPARGQPRPISAGAIRSGRMCCGPIRW